MRRNATLALVSLLLAVAGCGSSSSVSVSGPAGGHSLTAATPPPYLPGPLTGESTPRRLALRRPLGVIIENYDPDSRPQAGLGAASMVIETLAESGITRFLAIYLEGDAPRVGPVRSTRVYFDRWAAGFHMILAHVGGNDDAQALLWHLRPVFNLDEDRWERSLTDTGTPLFWRAATRPPPHNMYLSTFKLRTYATQHRQNWAYSQAYVPHKHPANFPARGSGGKLSIGFVNPLGPVANGDYAVSYTFDRKSDMYTRYMGGVPHIDEGARQPLHPSNIIVMRTGPAAADPAAGVTPQSISIPTIGSGQASFFMDGHVRYGTWRQKDQFAPLRFYDRKGRQVAFNPGQTWLEVAPAGTALSCTFR